MGVITLASLITLLVEIVFAAFRKSDDLIDGIAERLTCVEELLKDYGTGSRRMLPSGRRSHGWR